LLRGITFVEVLVLAVAGFGMFFLFAIARPLWPWDTTPFNAAFLGATYIASFAATLTLVLLSKWSVARMILRMLLVFTLVVLIVSVFNLSQFHFDRWASWAWFALYILLPLNAAYHLWLYRKLPPAQSVGTPQLWRAYLMAQGIVLGLYALALFMVPDLFIAFWPWPVDVFHAQMYSAIGFTAAIASFSLTWVASRDEFMALGLTQIALGLFALLGTLIVNNVSVVKKHVDFSVGGTWLWLGVNLWLFLMGIAMLVRWQRSSD
ncbi:MAG TPA: hypothetical protein VKQ72_20175, partial [Aggregatilineales bacterium]|nr:hypothetical protein [Aggregatilineales bacterium]